MHRSGSGRIAVFFSACLAAAFVHTVPGQAPRNLDDAKSQVRGAGSNPARIAAIGALAPFKDSSARQFLLDLLGEEQDREVRQAIHSQLGNHAHKSVVDALAGEFGKRADRSELRSISGSLARLGKKGQATLLQLLRSRDPMRQGAAVAGLRHVADKAAVAALLKVFDRAVPAVKIEILDVLTYQKDARPLFRLAQRAARDQDPKVRAKAFASLRAVPEAPAFEFLKTAFRDESRRGELFDIARGLSGQGPRGLRFLIDNLVAPEKRVRDAAVFGLGAAGRSDETLRALIDAFVAAPEDGQEGILHAMAGYKVTNGLTRVRLRALDAKRPGTRSEALVQLADQDHEVTREAALEQANDAGLMKQLACRARVIYALGTVLDAELLPRFLKLCRAPDYTIKRQMSRLLARQDGAVLRVLGKLGLEREDAQERLTVVHLLAQVADDKTTRFLVAALRDASPEVVRTATRALVQRGDARVVPFLEKGLDSEVEDLRLQAMLSLHKIQKGSVRWAKRVHALMRDGRGAMRFLALDLLTELAYRPALEDAQAMLADDRWQVRSAVYSYCRRVRDVSSIPLIIARLPAESGRLRAEALAALRSLTHLTYREAEQWQRWWDTAGAGFALPPPRDVDLSPTAPSVMTYYSIPLTSNAVCFLVDTSGSMAAEVGTAKITRLRAAQDALGHVIERCKPEFHFNVIPFSDRGKPWQAGIAPATAANKESARAHVKRLRPSGGTNIHDALQQAFADPAIDTIYLLSDGEPSAGLITNQADLADEVQLWNGKRKILLHTISIGRDSAMMERMARDSGGTYVRRL